MSLYTLHEKTQSIDLFYMKSNAWKYIWMIEKPHVDPRVYNDILWGLKALGDKQLSNWKKMLTFQEVQ